MNVLAIEDEPAMAGLLQSALTEEGYTVTTATNGREGLEYASSCRFDVIILDLMLPRMDGFSVARSLRRAHVQTPILVLTARDAPADIVRALDSGADDYVSKPFSLDVLLARVRAVSRRGEIPHSVHLKAGDLTVDTTTREVERGARRILLTPREYKLLVLLMQHAGRVLSRSFLIESIWGLGADIEENTLDAFIKLLRDKVEDPGLAKLIWTIRGVGYTLRDKPE